jgi:hypothetical protein
MSNPKWDRIEAEALIKALLPHVRMGSPLLWPPNMCVAEATINAWLVFDAIRESCGMTEAEFNAIADSILT